MKLSLILAPLIAAKVPHEVIMDTVLAFETQQIDALEKRRASDRERQNKKRMSRDITLCHTGSRSHARLEGSSSKEEITGKVNKEERTPAASPRSKATRLSSDWVIPEPWLAEAIEAGLSRSQALASAAAMRNWSLSDTKGAKLDWLATWRNWFAREAKHQQPRAGAPPGRKMTPTDANRILTEMHHERQAQRDNETSGVISADFGRRADLASVVRGAVSPVYRRGD